MPVNVAGRAPPPSVAPTTRNCRRSREQDLRHVLRGATRTHRGQSRGLASFYKTRRQHHVVRHESRPNLLIRGALSAVQRQRHKCREGPVGQQTWRMGPLRLCSRVTPRMSPERPECMCSACHPPVASDRSRPAKEQCPGGEPMGASCITSPSITVSWPSTSRRRVTRPSSGFRSSSSKCPSGQAFFQRNVFDVTSDGQRFLVNTLVEGALSAPITWVLNWAAELEL